LFALFRIASIELFRSFLAAEVVVVFGGHLTSGKLSKKTPEFQRLVCDGVLLDRKSDSEGLFASGGSKRAEALRDSSTADK
jgi:hypothetical protein